MIEYTIGQVVFSKCGHDKGKAYIILLISGEYLYLSDGDSRIIEKTKKKKVKHVQITQYVLEEIKAKIETDKSKLTNNDLKKALEPYKGKFNASNKEV